MKAEIHVIFLLRSKQNIFLLRRVCAWKSNLISIIITSSPHLLLLSDYDDDVVAAMFACYSHLQLWWNLMSKRNYATAMLKCVTSSAQSLWSGRSNDKQREQKWKLLHRRKKKHFLINIFPSLFPLHGMLLMKNFFCLLLLDASTREKARAM